MFFRSQLMHQKESKCGKISFLLQRVISNDGLVEVKKI